MLSDWINDLLGRRRRPIEGAVALSTLREGDLFRYPWHPRSGPWRLTAERCTTHERDDTALCVCVRTGVRSTYRLSSQVLPWRPPGTPRKP